MAWQLIGDIPTKEFLHYYKIYFPDFWTTTSQLYQGEVFSLRVSPWQEGGGGDW